MLWIELIISFCGIISIASACTTSPGDSSQSISKAISTTAATTASNSPVALSAEFASFQQKFGKKYGTDDVKKRQAIFEKRKSYIDQHNSNSSNTFKLGITQFVDWTDSEIQAMLPKISLPSTLASINISTQAAARGSYPDGTVTSYSSNCYSDWRLCGAVTPIKNQGGCGCCWAFSATGALESRWFIKYGTLPSLSEQHLVDCSPKAIYNNNGCNGGTADGAYAWIYDTKSYFTTGSAYPFVSGPTATAYACKFSTAMPRAAYLVSPGWAEVTSTSTTSKEQAIINALANGPVNAAFNVVTDSSGICPFQLYKSSTVFSLANCKNTIKDCNHQMLIVGYGTDSHGVKYWIVKNQWDTTWGIDGYAWIERGVNMCGIEVFITYPTIA